MSKQLVILFFYSYGVLLTPYGLAFGRSLNNCPENDINCNTTSMEFNPLFDERHKEFSTENSSYPIKFVLPAETDAADVSSPTRFRRFPKTCKASLSPLRYTTITCWAWPNFLSCEFSCIHGYALMEGGNAVLNTTRNCREEENYWKPKSAFPVCQPYINCQTILVGSGSLTCRQEDRNPWYCDISCMEDYEHDEVSLERYECLDNNYVKSLPHCASLDKSAVLIKPPKGLNVSSKGTLMPKQNIEPIDIQ